MWDKLCLSYEQKSEQRLEHLYLELLEYHKVSSDSIATHVSKMQKLWQELNEESFRIDGVRLPETLLKMRILSTLPNDYLDFRTTWESVPRDQRTVEYLLERLTMVELRMSQKHAEDRDSSSLNALLASGDKKKSNEQNGKPKRDFSKIRCYECNEFGHTKWRCPKGEKSRMLNQETVSKSSAMFGQALITEELDDVWIADTGASHHMTKTREYFSSFSLYDKPKPVTIGNKSLMMAYGHGNVRIEAYVDGEWEQHTLLDVWYTPDVVKNLFSVPSAANKGIEYWLNNRECKLTRNNVVLATGERYQSLYKLNIRVLCPKALACTAQKIDSLQIWHERLGHQNKRYVAKYLKMNGIKYIDNNEFCEGCILGKQHRLSFGTRVSESQKPGDLIHADVCGPMQEDSFSGCRYFVNFKDDYSKYRSVYCLKHKSDVTDKLRVFLAEAKNLGHTVKELLTDGGGEFDNYAVKSIVEGVGLHHRLTVPYTPEQNGSAERENRTLVEAARSMLQSKGLPLKLWAEAVNTAAHVINRSGPTKVKDKTPYELWTRKSTDVSHLKIFGTVCYVHVPKQKRQKLDSKALKGYLVGYCGEKEGYRVYVPDKDDVIVSRDVLFKDEETSSVYDKSNSDNEENDMTEVILSDNDNVSVSDDEENEPSPLPVIRSRREIRQPVRYDDYVMTAVHSEPVTFSEAVNCEHWHDWQEAMKDELKSLSDNNVWDLVDCPAGRNVVENKWVYRLKIHPDGKVDKFKARLVAKGYSQLAGLDYSETFSPVARFDTIRTVLSVAAAEKMKLVQFDVKTAFLYGNLDETIYMKQPTGYEDGTSRVCKLNKSLYGLKQSPRCWNRKFKTFLDKYGMQCSGADPCMFYSTVEGHKLLLALYVDDGLVTAQNESDMQQFLSELSLEFSVTVSPASCFLGLQIHQNSDSSVFINQEHYTRCLLAKFNMSDCNPVATPIDKTSTCLEADAGDMIDGSVPYREAVGSLLYLATCTRPDISYAVSVVSQSLSKPTRTHWEKVKRIFRYLKGTSGLGIMYKHGLNSDRLIAYSDADYAGDIVTRRSTSGFVCMFMGGPVSWSSQRQRSVALSTTESEYIAASEAAKEIVWFARLFKEITNFTTVPLLRVDNLSAVKLVQNPVYHKRSKHIDVRYHFVREKHEAGELVVDHVCGEEQLADVLTKPLSRDRFKRLLRDILSY